MPAPMCTAGCEQEGCGHKMLECGCVQPVDVDIGCVSVFEDVPTSKDAVGFCWNYSQRSCTVLLNVLRNPMVAHGSLGTLEWTWMC